MFWLELWNRVGRMGRRLDRLVAQWRAGTLPEPRERPSENGKRSDRVRKPSLSFPKGYGWLVARMPDIHQKLSDWELLLSHEESVRFLADVPAARKIVAVLERMLFVPPGKTVAKVKRDVAWPPPAWVEAVRGAQMVVGPTGRLEWL